MVKILGLVAVPLSLTERKDLLGGISGVQMMVQVSQESISKIFVREGRYLVGESLI